MVNLLQVLLTTSFPFRYLIGAGFMGQVHMAFLDYGPYVTCRDWWVSQLHEIAHPSYTRVLTEMVYFRYFVWLLHGSSAYRQCRLITLFYGVKPSLGYLGQPVTKVTSMHSSYSSDSFLIVLSPLLLSISLAALVGTLALPVKMPNTQDYTHKESVCICNF